MSQSAVAKRYAQAIFELGVDQANVAALVGEVKRLAEAWDASGELRAALANPLVSEAARLAIVKDLCAALGLSPTARNAAGLLAQRRRLSILPDVADELARLSDERAGVVRATVTSAAPLSEATRQKLQQQLEKRTGKKVLLEVRQDPTLIAGLVARIGDLVIDGSARARLAELRTQLLPQS